MSGHDLDGLERALGEFVARHADRPAASEPLEPETELFTVGLLDSVDFLDLVAVVEHAIGRDLPDEVLSYDNFRSTAAIVRMVQTLPTPGPALGLGANGRAVSAEDASGPRRG
jgi:acyl carrier protein